MAIESMVPAAMGRRIEPSALDLCRVMMRLRRKRVADRPPVIEGVWGVVIKALIGSVRVGSVHAELCPGPNST